MIHAAIKLTVILAASSMGCGFLSLSGAIRSGRPLSLIEYKTIKLNSDFHTIKVLSQTSIGANSDLIPDSIVIRFYGVKIPAAGNLIVSKYDLCGRDTIRAEKDFSEIWVISPNGSIKGRITGRKFGGMNVASLNDSILIWRALGKCNKC